MMPQPNGVNPISKIKTPVTYCFPDPRESPLPAGGPKFAKSRYKPSPDCPNTFGGGIGFRWGFRGSFVMEISKEDPTPNEASESQARIDSVGL